MHHKLCIKCGKTTDCTKWRQAYRDGLLCMCGSEHLGEWRQVVHHNHVHCTSGDMHNSCYLQLLYAQHEQAAETAQELARLKSVIRVSLGAEEGGEHKRIWVQQSKSASWRNLVPTMLLQQQQLSRSGPWPNSRLHQCSRMEWDACCDHSNSGVTAACGLACELPSDLHEQQQPQAQLVQQPARYELRPKRGMEAPQIGCKRARD
jgi:hypothetical protein